MSHIRSIFLIIFASAMYSPAVAQSRMCPAAAMQYNQLTGPYGGPPQEPQIGSLSCPDQVNYIKRLEVCVSNAPAVATGVFDQNKAILSCEKNMSVTLSAPSKSGDSALTQRAPTNINALKTFAPKLLMFEGRWSDGKCSSRWNDWSVTGLEITFHDQSGGVDVERVIDVDSRGFRTQSVMASRGAVGGLWRYQPLATDTIRVQNVSSGVMFYLRKCQSSPEAVGGREAAANEATTSIPQPRTAAQDRIPVKIAPFTVIVNFSPQARQRMTELGEYLAIYASFYGEPNKRGEKYADNTGRVQLGEAAQTVPMKSYASATFSGNGIDLTKLPFIKEEEPFVLINVSSARRSTSNNLLDCGVFQDPVLVAARGPVTLVCRLIGED